LAVAAELIEEQVVQPLPHPRALPVTQPPHPPSGLLVLALLRSVLVVSNEDVTGKNELL
jgi:hypothetical protein